VYGEKDPAAAIELLARALALAEAHHAADSAGLGSYLNDLAGAYHHAGDYARARGLFLRGLAVERAARGDDHPFVGYYHFNLAETERALGRWREARAGAERALAIWSSTLGPTHPLTGNACHVVGLLLAREGDTAAGLAQLERAIDVVPPADQRRIHDWRTERALLREQAGDIDGAREELEELLAACQAAGELEGAADTARQLSELLLRQRQRGRALAVWRELLAEGERALGAGHPQLGYLLTGLAETLRRTGDCRRAAPAIARARGGWQAAEGADHPALGYPLAAEALCDLDRGQPARALPLLERAVALLDEVDDQQTLALARFALARALVGSGGDPARALALAHDARGLLDGMWPRGAFDRAAVEAWLAAHPPPAEDDSPPTAADPAR
jgi:tetratricopeptide (TPR) repeat protein